MSNTVSDDEIRKAAPLLQRLARCDRRARQALQRFDVDVLPINFYSNAPSVEDVLQSYEYLSPDPPYANDALFHPGRLARVLDRLHMFSSEFVPDLDAPNHAEQSFFWRNSQFSYSDAMAYYCFIRALQPRTVFEIGSGYSTLVAVTAVERNRSGRIICVEPYPRPFLVAHEGITLKQQRAQTLTPEELNETLSDGDILFIDSTHTVKTGSDCLHIYLRLLPRIRRDIFVHVHDVFLPFGIPSEWLLDRQLHWTEQYLLLAFLLDNPKVTVLFGSAVNMHVAPERMINLMHERYGAGGSSFWFRYRGDLGDVSVPAESSVPSRLDDPGTAAP
jgi:hypothetical protein